MEPAAKLQAATRCIPLVAFIGRPVAASASSLREVLVSVPAIECRLPDRSLGNLRMPPASRADTPALVAPGSILKSLLAAIMGSLHRSRRRQARRIVREYRHLIASEARCEADVQKAAKRRLWRMSMIERPLQAESSAKPAAISETAWLAMIATGFLLVHILTITVLMQVTAGVATPPQEQTRPSYND
jgi:hypothetical protein